MDDQRFQRCVGFKEDSDDETAERTPAGFTTDLKQHHLPVCRHKLPISVQPFILYRPLIPNQGRRGQVTQTFSTSGWHKLKKLLLAHVGVKRAQKRARQAFPVLPGKPD